MVGFIQSMLVCQQDDVRGQPYRELEQVVGQRLGLVFSGYMYMALGALILPSQANSPVPSDRQRPNKSTRT